MIKKLINKKEKKEADKDCIDLYCVVLSIV